jgi:L-threonylcarbamoyladenylate synthase
MIHFTNFHDPELIDALRKNQVGVIPTDTQYGLVGKALVVPVVERIYQLKQRDHDKPLIILIPALDDLDTFFVKTDERTKSFLTGLWPAPISVILPCQHESFDYLHRGTQTLAFRMPQHPELRELLSNIGPLVAPSANLEGQTPASTIKEAQEYFNAQVDFYLDGGVCDSPPSTLIKIENQTIEVIRQGVVEITQSHIE